MDFTRLFHPTKMFAEITDSEVEQFLRDRAFGREHLNLEFKREFPVRSGGKYDIREICKYIAGYSNEEGGLVVFGVADSIKDASTPFDDYVVGLSQEPSLEDLSQWVTDRVAPLIQSPAIRRFTLGGKSVVVMKVPQGVNRPYAYVEPSTNAMTYFKKTAGGIRELRPEEVKELYWDAIIHQSDRILRAGILRGMDVAVPPVDQFGKHRARATALLEDVANFGRVSIYCVPDQPVDIPVADLKEFIERQRGNFSEVLRYFPGVEIFQDGVSAGYFPRAIRQDIKSTARVTLTKTGLVAWDSQADMSMDRDGVLHPYWLSYEVQRHLQFAKALLEPRGVTSITVYVELENMEQFRIKVMGDFFMSQPEGAYSGSHDQIKCRVNLADINPASGDRRNIVFPAARQLMDEIFTIFGFEKAAPQLWGDDGSMVYTRGISGR